MASALAELGVRQCSTPGLSRFGSSEMGDCTTGVSSVLWRESGGERGESKEDVAGRGLRRTEHMLVRGVSTLPEVECGRAGASEVVDTLSDVGVMTDSVPSAVDDEAMSVWHLAFFSLIFALTASGWILSALRVATGKSATPINMLLNVLMIAPPPPVIGSHGPSSTS